ncbi:MAG: hypothetical protein RI967_2208 [Planctomycetota bacterium]|jgi:uncharacterized zinc-type alcohol dehydrogenase-like protein
MTTATTTPTTTATTTAATSAPPATATPPAPAAIAHFHAFAALAARARLEPFEYEPLPLGDDDVEIAITHCGVCHSDAHLVDDEWGISSFPLVPGHEIVGRVEAKGRRVRHLATGDLVGVGWTRDACLHCHECLVGNEHLCLATQGTCVGHFGGFADRMRVSGEWAFRIPDGLDAAATAPLLGAGATVYGALLAAGARAAMRVGVCGLGGLGHLAVRFARAMGCEVTVFSGTTDKRDDALALGAHHFIAPGWESAASAFDDIVLATSPTAPDWNALLRRLRPNGTLVVLGPVGATVAAEGMPLVSGRRRIMGSCAAGRATIHEMLAFAARHRIGAQVERFAFTDAAAALDRAREGKARYRVVLERELAEAREPR